MFSHGGWRCLCRALIGAAVFGVVVASPRFTPAVRAQARTVAIHDIQGAASRSPLAGEVVTTRAIVTARKSNGIFIQAPDDAVDADPRSSEGIFVFTGAVPATNLTPGTFVAVTGRVIEFIPAGDPSSPPLTEIGEPLAIEVRGAGATLPAAIEIHPRDVTPGGGHEQLERLAETTAAAPLITPRYVPPPGPSIAVVRVSEFRVVRSAPSKNSNSFHYIPLVRLAEDGGVSAAWITGAVFTLLDIGSAGRVPDPSVDGYLPAGGTLDFLRLVGTVYGDPDVEISSSINATRVRVTITFADNQGRAGSVTSDADVDP